MYKIKFLIRGTSIYNLFGFYYCEIITPNDLYLGLLPHRTKNGSLLFPLGKWRGWYFSEEFKFAQNNGYKIKVLNGYTFSKSYNTFINYINTIYQHKVNSINIVEKSISKSLLNNLLGRFGIKLDKTITEIVSTKRFSIMRLINKISGYQILSEDKILVSYTPGLDNNIIKSNNLDIAKISKVYKDKERLGYENSSIAISAAVTAYGRIHISQLKLDIINMGGSIYYSDTDSIVTNIKLPSNFVSPTELGKLKLEHNIKHGIFITGKTYCMITYENKFINKAKGIKSKSLNYTDYCLLLNNVDILNIN